MSQVVLTVVLEMRKDGTVDDAMDYLEDALDHWEEWLNDGESRAADYKVACTKVLIPEEDT